jgi:hypothetical protein
MMKPSKSILDTSFSYVPAAATAVDKTWRRFGWRPTTEQERLERQAAKSTRHLIVSIVDQMHGEPELDRTEISPALHVDEAPHRLH